jgi:hypothetical protein
MWRYLKLVVILAVVAVVAAIAKNFVQIRLEQRADNAIPQLVAKQQAMLPVKINDRVELTGVSYDNRTLHYEATSKRWMDPSEVDAQLLRQRLRTDYCKNMKPFVDANVSVEFEVEIPPKTLNDRMTRISIDIHPAECR